MTGLTNGTLAFYSRSTTQMGTIRREAEKLQTRLSTGTRIDRSSEDPVAASRLRSLGRADRLGAIDASNAARAKDGLTLTAGSLAAVAQDMGRVRELALWAGTETLSANQRASIGQEIAQLRLTILANVNARDVTGQPLFAGEAGGPAYQLDAAGNAIYAGTAVSGEIALGEGQSVTRGVTGPEFVGFSSGGNTSDIFAMLKSLGDALQGGSADPAAAATAALSDLDAALDGLTRTQTIVGTRLAWIETVQDRQVAQSENRASETADVGGVDLATTIAELQQKLTVLEASQAGFSRLSSLSLFDAF